MNIFFLSWIIEHCAKYHCDKHVVKMILETCQLLSTCHHVINPKLAEELTSKSKIYRKTHVNHPCSIWVRECKENYIWLTQLGLALCDEYAYRYDKQPSDHACYSKLIFLMNNLPKLPENNGKLTIPKLAMPDKYKTEDPIYSYRLYYLNEKQRMLVWRKRGPAYWVPSHLLNEHQNYERKIKKNDT